MFNKDHGFNRFAWEDLGDVEKGRPNLGLLVPVLAYRLLEYTFRDVLISELGDEKANDIIIKAGRLAGYHFCENMLNKESDFNIFVAELQRVLKELKIGILRVEKVDLGSMEMTLTVAEDLDCSGLPFTDKVVCQYDEGFIAGILESFTGKSFQVKEIDCWASGDRVCRFDVRQQEDNK
ncbi:MAG: V4R domain-containing protein [Thermodesulfobacteriota bacterium]|nr:V4R domain-containing protein [Thermodesulfobacteriota bacterium]